jgi:phage shock protein C
VNQRLYRSPDDRVLAGVAGGMAETYDLDPALVRVGWVLLTLLTGGVFLVLYIVMALVVPLRPTSMQFGWVAAPDSGTPGATSSGAGAPASPGPSGGPTTPGGPRQPDWYRRDRRRDGAGPLVIGLLFILVGAFFLIRQFLPDIDIDLLWPLAVIAVGVLFIVGAFARPDHSR